jgi:hypothetical protein
LPPSRPRRRRWRWSAGPPWGRLPESRPEVRNRPVLERGQRINQSIDKVTVVGTPPKDDSVNNVVIVFGEQLGPGQRLDAVPQVKVNVVVVTELLNQIPILETQFARHICHCAGVGLAHFVPPGQDARAFFNLSSRSLTCLVQLSKTQPATA